MKKKYNKKFIKAFDNRFSICSVDKKSVEYRVMLKLIKDKLLKDNETKQSEIASFTELMGKVKVAEVQKFSINIFELAYVEIRIYDFSNHNSDSYMISYDDLTQNQKSFIHFIARQCLNMPRNIIDKIIEIFKEARNVAIARNNVYIDYIDNE